MFRYYSCIFKINSFKETTARAIILRRIGVPLSYTIETSNGSYFDYEKLADVPYTQALWKSMGGKVGEALFEYVDLVLSADRNSTTAWLPGPNAPAAVRPPAAPLRAAASAAAGYFP